MTSLQWFFWRITWRVRSWLRGQGERAALRRFERETDRHGAICANCRQPFAAFTDDFVLTPDATPLCLHCDRVIEATAAYA